ncbi:aconitate hydratase AcnA [Mangrovihabitans endophyticus]|uniref:Aconitate hydratase n=1 Tax=Mangrovihabitans endophyticus TaxID=1751298 RepID=A0A8J3BW44_9ACTN|nr:aconitate hydratase AcnA [Mangrovihabitans endophyticus]GGK78936.1 aconitate hydratase [Mangrovihabitans endophyticus]
MNTRRRAGSADEAVRHPLAELAAEAGGDLGTMPYSMRVLLENVAHLAATGRAAPASVASLVRSGGRSSQAELPFHPSRVVLQDFSGVPVVLDLLALRSAAVRKGLPASRVEPVIPAHLVVDHAARVDVAGVRGALEANLDGEYQRNAERYALLRWAEQAFANLTVIPPGNGIIHQINLERLARVVSTQREPDGRERVRPDTVLGTDSHTPMVGALGVLAWGVGGIEATSVLLGEPVLVPLPRVVEVRMTGRLRPGVTVTDLALTLTQQLRGHDVVGAFLEFTGDGVGGLGVPDRATIANMAPEYGATTAFFPVDDETLRFLRATGRTPHHVSLVEAYCKDQGLFAEQSTTVRYARTLTVDLSSIEPCLAGPRTPHDRVPLARVPASFRALRPVTASAAAAPGVPDDGAVLLAALTSCTNTSNPAAMATAGLVARRAVESGLRVKPWVKASLAPGSRAVPAYLDRAGLLAPLEDLGFAVVAYGCASCHGMSGPLLPAAAQAVAGSGIAGVAVLSGNRNFDGRVHPDVRAAYLASPGLVVAYALAGTVTRDLTTEPVALAPDGRAVHLRDLWPSPREVEDAVAAANDPGLFTAAYAGMLAGDDRWRSLPSPAGELYEWDAGSTYVLPPPFLDQSPRFPAGDITGARVLALLDDDVSTDHISPVGAIPIGSDAGQYLLDSGVSVRDLDSYGTRRGNHHVMVRGTFSSPRLRNALAGGRPGPSTVLLPEGRPCSIHAAAVEYAQAGVPLAVVAGKRYGLGSARDWAAKGTALLGVRVVLAEGFERIHRSNLVGTGVLPLCFPAGQSSGSHGIDGTETIDVLDLADLRPRKSVTVRLGGRDGSVRTLAMTAAVETDREVQYLRGGGLLPHVMAGLT